MSTTNENVADVLTRATDEQRGVEVDGRAVDALIAEKVMGITLSVVSPQDYARAVMSAMTYSNGRGGLGFRVRREPNSVCFEVVSPESHWGYKGTDGNDGYGLWVWEHRDGQLWQAALEEHVAEWRRWVPNYTTSAFHDYSVLEHVRKTWMFSMRVAFAKALDAIWQNRVALLSGREVYPNAAMRYEPGDYSRAALAVVTASPVPQCLQQQFPTVSAIDRQMSETNERCDAAASDENAGERMTGERFDGQ